MNDWLSLEKFNKAFRKDLTQAHGEENVVSKVSCSIMALAWAYRCVFAVSFASTTDAVKEVHRAVNEAKIAMKACWSGIQGISFDFVTNFHRASHAHESIILFGSIRLASCARGEAKICQCRRTCRNCNHNRPEYDMLQQQNITGAVNFMVAGGARCLPNHPYDDEFLDFIEDNPTLRSLLSLSVVTDNYAGHEAGEDAVNESVGYLSGPYTTEADSDLHEESSIVQFYSALIPNRERCFAKVQVNEVYFVKDSDEKQTKLARVDSIWCEIDDFIIKEHDNRGKTTGANFDHVAVEVTWLREQKGDDTSKYAFEVYSLPVVSESASAQTKVLPITSVLRPAHVFPLCPQRHTSQSRCAVATSPGYAERPQGCYGFCAGLNHNPARSSSTVTLYALNHFLVK